MEAAGKLFGLFALVCLAMCGFLAITHAPPVKHEPPAPPQEKIIYTTHSMSHIEAPQVKAQLASCKPAELYSKSLKQYLRVCLQDKKMAFQILVKDGLATTVISMFFAKGGQPVTCAVDYVNMVIRTDGYKLISGVLPYGVHAAK